MARTKASGSDQGDFVALRPVRQLGSPALAIVETRSIALGYVLGDAAVKRASVELMACRPICPGRFLVAVSGETEAVRQSHEAMLELASEASEERSPEPLSEILISRLDAGVLPAIRGAVASEAAGPLGVVETTCSAGVVLAADGAAKEAPVRLLEIQLAQGIGGKGVVLLTGDLPDVEAATARGAAIAAARGELVRQVVIPRPHEDVWAHL